MSDEEQDKKDEEFMKEIEEDVKKPVEEEELPETHPLRFVAWLLAHQPLATAAWVLLGFILFVLIMNPGIVYVTPDISFRAGDVGMLLLIVYIAVSAYIYYLWRRNVNYARAQAQSEQAGTHPQ